MNLPMKNVKNTDQISKDTNRDIQSFLSPLAIITLAMPKKWIKLKPVGMS